MMQDSYLYQGAYCCATVYHDMRSAARFEGLESLPGNPSKEYTKLFYTEGTIQNRWNQLYNDYCTRIYAVVPKDELTKLDERIVRWTELDIEGNEKFKLAPCAPPT